jgi:hypothetical protein
LTDISIFIEPASCTGTRSREASMKTRSGILKRAAAFGLTPPAAALVGMRLTDNPEWVRPTILGAALWVTLAVALAAFAIARLQRRSQGVFTP